MGADENCLLSFYALRQQNQVRAERRRRIMVDARALGFQDVSTRRAT